MIKIPDPNSEHSYPQDAIDDPDNGAYMNSCGSCKAVFIGHKRRYACRKCSEAWKVKWDAIPPEQQREELLVRIKLAVEFFKDRVKSGQLIIEKPKEDTDVT